MSPVLAGGFLTTAPPGKSKCTGFYFILFSGDPPKPLGFRHQASGTLARAEDAEVGVLGKWSLMEDLGFTLEMRRVETTLSPFPGDESREAGPLSPQEVSPSFSSSFPRPHEIPRAHPGQF